MATHPPSSAHRNDDLATNSICRTMASWIVASSSNKNQAHQFRLQSSFALIGFGAVASSIFIENGGLYIGAVVLPLMIMIALFLDNYYFKEEQAWLATCIYIDTCAISISRKGINLYEKSGGKVVRPDKIYRYYLNQKDGLSKQDYTTKMLRFAGFVVAISIGVFAGIKFDKFEPAAGEIATETGREQLALPTLPRMQKLLQTPSKP